MRTSDSKRRDTDADQGSWACTTGQKHDALGRTASHAFCSTAGSHRLDEFSRLANFEAETIFAQPAISAGPGIHQAAGIPRAAGIPQTARASKEPRISNKTRIPQPLGSHHPLDHSVVIAL